jgi:hypothetical protein
VSVEVDPLVSRLEELSDDLEWVVECGGETVVVRFFEGVDPTIYDRGDLVVAQVVEKLVGDKRFHTPGTFIEYNVGAIEKVFSKDEGTVVYERSGT